MHVIRHLEMLLERRQRLRRPAVDVGLAFRRLRLERLDVLGVILDIISMYATSNAVPVLDSSCFAIAWCSAFISAGSATPSFWASAASSAFAWPWSWTICCPKLLTSGLAAFATACLPSVTSSIPPLAAFRRNPTSLPANAGMASSAIAAAVRRARRMGTSLPLSL
jgi:hypothetical protein